MRPSLVLTGLLALAGTGASGSANELPSGAGTGAGEAPSGREPLSFARVYERVLAPRCGPCHTIGASGELQMPDAVRAYASIINVAGRGACNGRLLVVPGVPEASALLDKVSDGELCGTHMPLGRASLSEDEIALVRQWIEEGAQP
jgi:hypothetical protein